MALGTLVRVDRVATFVTAFKTSALRDSSGVAEEELRARAQQDGYLFVPGLLDAERVLAVRRRVLDVCTRFGWLVDGSDGVARDGVRLGAYDEDWVAMQREVTPSPEFAALGGDQRVLGVLESIFEEPVRGGVGAVCRVTSPAAGDLATPPHQDHHFITRTDAFWTVWIPLGDCPQRQGGLAVLPGSHREGLRAHGADDSVEVEAGAVWVTADYGCGDALFFHCLTLHRACPNETPDRVRVSADYRYEPAACGVGGSEPKAAATRTAVPLTSPRTTGPTGT